MTGPEVTGPEVADPAPAPWPRTARFDRGRLWAVGGVDVANLVRDHATPLYVLDWAELVGRMRAYRQAFGDDVAVTYGSKALCVVGVLQLAKAEGLHVDVASAGELATAERAGYPPERIVFHGNNKSIAELERAASLGVGRIVADSFAELDRLSALGQRRGRDLPVMLRITPGVKTRTHDAIATGHDDSKFGFTLSSGVAQEAVSRALSLPGVALHGLHCHVGSQLTDASPFEAAAALMLGLLADIREAHGITLSELNLGGGLGIAYRPDDPVVDVGAYAAGLRATVAREAGRLGLPVPSLAVEPGRSIAGPAGLTLYTVGTVKDVPGTRRYASVDGGLSDNPRPALYDARYEFAACAPSGTAAAGEAQQAPTAVVGKHCESGDVLARDVPLPADLGEGDVLAVAATGAYAHSMSSNYNRIPRPAVVLVGDGGTRTLVRRETLDDVIARDRPLSADEL